jgi:hypothetical protein
MGEFTNIDILNAFKEAFDSDARDSNFIDGEHRESIAKLFAQAGNQGVQTARL